MHVCACVHVNVCECVCVFVNVCVCMWMRVCCSFKFFYFTAGWVWGNRIRKVEGIHSHVWKAARGGVVLWGWWDGENRTLMPLWYARGSWLPTQGWICNILPQDHRRKISFLASLCCNSLLCHGENVKVECLSPHVENLPTPLFQLKGSPILYLPIICFIS